MSQEPERKLCLCVYARKRDLLLRQKRPINTLVSAGNVTGAIAEMIAGLATDTRNVDMRVRLGQTWQHCGMYSLVREHILE